LKKSVILLWPELKQFKSDENFGFVFVDQNWNERICVDLELLNFGKGVGGFMREI
jgi:hypothetical protein